jgi:hypothetical protein
MQEADQAPSLPTFRKVLCIAYGAIAVAALIATWSQGGPYAHSIHAFVVGFWSDTKVTSASRFIAADILLFGLAATILMVTEARKHNVRFVWAYIAAAFPSSPSVLPFLFSCSPRAAHEIRLITPSDYRHDPARSGGPCGLSLTIWVDWG